MKITAIKGKPVDARVCEPCNVEVPERFVATPAARYCEECNRCTDHCICDEIEAGLCDTHNSFDCGCPGVGI